MSKTRERAKDAARILARQFKRQRRPDGDIYRGDIPDPKLARSKRI